MVAIPTTQNLNSEAANAYLVMLLNPQSNTPLVREYSRFKADIRNGLLPTTTVRVSDVTLNGSVLTVTRANATNRSLTLPSSGGGGTTEPTVTVGGGVPDNSTGANGDIHLRVSVTAGNLTNVTSIYTKDSGSWSNIQSIVSATQSNIYTELKNILQQGTNVTLTEDDTDSELTIAASGTGGTTVGGMQLTLAGSADNISDTGSNITTDGTNGLTRTAVEDVFLVDLHYTRTTSNLRMSGIVRKADLPGTTRYLFQLQGAGPDYVSLAFSTADNTGVLTARNDADSVSSINVRIFNIVGTTVTGQRGPKGDKGDAGTGAGVLSGTRPPVAGDGSNGDFWLEGDSGGSYLAVWNKAAGSWTRVGEVRDNPTYGLTADDVSAIQHLPIVPTYTPSTRVAVAVFDWNNPPTTGVSSFTYATRVSKRASVGQLMYLRVPIGDIDDFAILRGRASVSHRGLDEGFQHLAADDTASYRYYEPRRIEGFNSGSNTVYTWDEYSAETDIDVDHLDDDVIARLVPTGGAANQHLAKNASNNGLTWATPPAAGGGSVSFADAKVRDSANGVGGSASTAARSDHGHARSSIYSQSSHTHGNSIGRIPTGSPGNNKFWGTNGSGTDAWYDQSSLGGGGGSTITFVKPSTSQDYTGNSIPAQAVWSTRAAIVTAVNGISSPSEGDIAYGAYRSSSRNWVNLWVYTDPSGWVNVTSRSLSGGAFAAGAAGASDGSDEQQVGIDAFRLDETYPQWWFVYSGPSLYQKQTDTSADATQPNLGDRQAWEKIWPRDIPELISPSYQGDTDWLSPHAHFPRTITQTLDDVTGVHNGQALAVEIEADLPDTHVGNVTFTAEKASGGSVSNSPTLLNGRNFYLLNIDYTTVPDLDLSPVAIVTTATVDGTYRIKLLSAYHLDGRIDDESWEMYKLNLDTLEERAVMLEGQNSFKGQWSNRGFYQRGDFVSNGDHPTLYQRLTAMDAPPTTDQEGPRGDRTNWTPVGDWIGEWQSGMYLSPGNVVSRNTAGRFKLYMVTADIDLGDVPPEDAQGMLRIDREHIEWAEIEDKPTIDVGVTGETQHVYLSSDQSDTTRWAPLHLAEGGATPRDGMVTWEERENLQGLNRWAHSGRTPLDGEWRLDRQYYAGEIVGYFSHIYTANSDHVSTADNGPRGANSLWVSQLELRVETQNGPILGSITSPSSPDDLQTLALNGWMFYRGGYNNSYTYHAQNLVEQDGALWLARRDVTGVAPVAGLDWLLIRPAQPTIPTVNVPSMRTRVVICTATSSQAWAVQASSNVVSKGDIPNGAKVAISFDDGDGIVPAIAEFYWPTSIPTVTDLVSNANGAEARMTDNDWTLRTIYLGQSGSNALMFRGVPRETNRIRITWFA